jgi:hypothetical protein
MDNLLTLHLKEEWRMMTSYFNSKKLFIAFPFVLLVIGFFMASLIPFIEKAFNMKELVTAFHFLLLVYGLFVGGFGFFADEVAERWFKDVNLLIHMHHVLPMSFRRIFVWFYVKDIIYYLLLTLFPLFLGSFLSMVIPLSVFVKVMVSLILSFLIGVSTSFLISSLYVRTRLSLIVVGAALIVLTQFSYTDFPPLAFLFKKDSLSLVVSVSIFMCFSALSLIITKPVTRRASRTFSKTGLFSQMDPYLAKEIIDVKRSGTWQIIITSYVFPLLFLYGIFYFSQRLLNFELRIPLLFYAVFMGYLSTLVYSWLNNIDPPSPLVILPVSTAHIIKKKVNLFLIFSFSIGITYLIGFSIILREMTTLPVALFSLVSTTFYVAVVTAWLCGLYPNTRLFDGTILAQYMGAILPVLVILSILSLMGEYLFICMVSALILIGSLLVYRNLDTKYERVYVK